MASRTLTVTLVGDAKSAVRAMNATEREAAGMGRALDAAESKASRMGKTLNSLGGQFGFMANPAMLAAGAVTAMAGAAVLAVKEFAAFGDAIEEMSQRTGFSTESLSELKHAADLSGTSIEGLEVGIRRMQRSILDAQQGTKAAVDSLNALGVSAAQLHGLAPEEQFTVLASALADVADDSTKAALAQEVFGRSGTALLPMLADGAAGLEAMRAEARELGIVMSAEDAAAAAEFQDAMARLGAQVTSAKFQLGSTLVPALTAVVDEMGAAFTATGEVIAGLAELERQVVNLALPPVVVTFVGKAAGNVSIIDAFLAATGLAAPISILRQLGRADAPAAKFNPLLARFDPVTMPALERFAPEDDFPMQIGLESTMADLFSTPIDPRTGHRFVSRAAADAFQRAQKSSGAGGGGLAAEAKKIREEAEHLEKVRRTSISAIEGATTAERALLNVQHEMSKGVLSAAEAMDAFNTNLETTGEKAKKVALSIVKVGESVAFVNGQGFSVGGGTSRSGELLGSLSREVFGLLDAGIPLTQLQGLVSELVGILGLQGALAQLRNLGIADLLAANGVSLEGFASGGVVPGPVGAPRLAMVHGGETVLPTHRRGGAAGGINITVNALDARGAADAVLAVLVGLNEQGRLGRVLGTA